MREFLAALLFATARELTNREKYIISNTFRTFAGVFCDDNFCSLYIPMSQMRYGCREVQRLRSLLKLEYECDVEDVIMLPHP